MGALGFTAGPLRQLAGNDGGDEECKQSDPILRIRDGQGPIGWKEVIVEGQGRQHRHEYSGPQAPIGGDHQNADQERKRDRGRVYRERDPVHCDQRRHRSCRSDVGKGPPYRGRFHAGDCS